MVRLILGIIALSFFVSIVVLLVVKFAALVFGAIGVYACVLWVFWLVAPDEVARQIGPLHQRMRRLHRRWFA